MPSFYTLPTALGEAKIANAIALGTQVNISELAVGDGGGSLPTPDSDRTALVNELRRAPINRIEVDDENPNWIVVEQILPPDVGGWTVRELGLLDDDGNLIAYGNYPETYKPVLSEGSGRTQTIRFVMQVSDTAAVTLKVDPSVVLATRQYVDDADHAHAESRNHPAATESAQGMIQRATSVQALAGSDNSRAMTPARVHEAFLQFGLGEVKVSSNWDSINKTGFYTNQSSGQQETPLAVDSLNVIHIESGDNATQTCFRSRSDGVQSWIRARSQSVWGPWVEIFHSGNLKAATDEIKGIVELATSQETIAGSDIHRAVHSAGTKAAIDDRVANQEMVDSGSNDAKFVTPKKLKAWAGSWVKQASETVTGMLKVATQAEADAGTDDSVAVTPKKLRWGVSYSLGKTGYLVLPSWLGGVILQWKEGGASVQETSFSDTFPIAFPNNFWVATVTDLSVTDSTNSSSPKTFEYISKTQYRVWQTTSAPTQHYLIAIGN
ncbi:phage tail protein [Halomonas sp. RT37]|uniref:Phage tail protein n=1 Tax=Halomonas sp. RT37 TaxID=2950872 RepID=A0AAU7KE85_9GAMM